MVGRNLARSFETSVSQCRTDSSFVVFIHLHKVQPKFVR